MQKILSADIKMKIEIRTFATLAVYSRHPGIDKDSGLEITNGSTVKMLIEILGIPEDHIKLIFVNGRHNKIDTVLSEGDRVGLFPPVGGG